MINSQAIRFDLPTRLCKRHATRYEPEQRDASLSWCESDRHFVETHFDAADHMCPALPKSLRQFALLLDISHTGASIVVDQIPQSIDQIQMRIEGPSPSEWTGIRLINVTTTPTGPHVIHLAFLTPCPFEMLQAAICG